MSTIQLGAPGALRKYMVKARGDGLLWGRGPANPFAAKVNSSNKYDEVDIWNEWVQEDWQAGVGHVDAEAGGFLYGEVETRVPNQLILPSATIVAGMLTPDTANYDWAYGPGEASSDLRTLTLGATYLGMKVDATNAGTLNVTGVWIYAEAATGTVIRADLYSSGGSVPDASLGNASATITANFPGPHWHYIPLSVSNPGTSTDAYWVVLRVTTGSAILHGKFRLTTFPSVRASVDGVTGWTQPRPDDSIGYIRPFFNVTVTLDASADAAMIPASITRIVYSTDANDVLYIGPSTRATATKIGLFVLNSGNYVTRTTGTLFAGTPTDAAVFGNSLVVAQGSSGPIYLFALDGTGGAAPAGNPAADHLLQAGGYAYRSLGNDLYYSSDSTLVTWTGPFEVTTAPWQIRSIATLTGDVYMACDDGLYRFAPGDVVEGITPWTPHSSNGRAMVAHGGALYIVVNGRVWRMTADGALEDIWVSRDDDLPATRLGEVVSLALTDTTVMALVKETAATGRGSVWAYQEEGWHHIATLPTSNGNVLYYDRANNRLHIGTSNGQIFYVNLAQFAINPYNDPDITYMPAGWLQTDRFYGGQLLLEKDWESVIVLGENLSVAQKVYCYWQDADSTAWELLGTADSNGEELRWSTYSTRPVGTWIKLGVLLYTREADKTPRVRALVVKFLPMVNDRVRDTLTLTLYDYITFPDNTQDTYTRAQQWTHLDSMIRRVHPFIYQDPFGDQYEVKIVDWSVNAPAYNSDTGVGTTKEMEVTLVVEQVPDAKYGVGTPMGLLLALTSLVPSAGA